MQHKERKFVYLTKNNIKKIERIKEKFGTSFTGALNILLTNETK